MSVTHWPRQLERTTKLLQNIGMAPLIAVVYLGYCGVDAAVAPVQIIHCSKIQRVSGLQRRWLRRRQTVEPAIGDAKPGLQRCWIKVTGPTKVDRPF